MYYLKGDLVKQEKDFLYIEVNKICYRGIKIFLNNCHIQNSTLLYVLNYKNEFINQLLFFIDENVRNICELLLNIKNVGVTTIKKIFSYFQYNEFLNICKNQDLDFLIKKTNLSENVCKKIMQEVRLKLFKQKYNVKQMNVINSLNKLGYKISDIYKAIETIDFKLNEQVILEKALLNLNNYGY